MATSLICRGVVPLGVVLMLGAALGAPAGHSSSSRNSQASRTSYLLSPFSFEPNRGQAGSSVQFLSRGAQCTLFLMAGGQSLFRLPVGDLDMKPGGAASKPRAEGIEPLSGSVNILVGNDRSKWQTNMTVYSAVRFQRVYPGIDLVYHAGNDQLEYDFIVSPGADPGAISLDFSGARRIELDTGGNLVFSFPGGTVQHRKPSAYQRVGQTRREISGRYLLAGTRRVRFEIGPYDRTLPLIIDPVVSYSTFVGGASDDGAFSVALDREGNIYVAGITRSLNFPRTTGTVPGRAFPDATDAFVAKLNPQGTALLYATYLGGSDEDTAMAIAVDAAGNAYLTGGTNSRDFPTTDGAFQPRFGGTGGSSLPPFTHPSGDAFVAKLNPAGSSLIYSSYLGGSAQDLGYGIAVDPSGTAFIAGTSVSTDLPVTRGVVQPAPRGSAEIFAARINSAGTALLYSTYLGGSGEDLAFALALDASGNAYVTGATNSNDFPVTPGAFQTRRSGRSASYVAKLNGAATALAYATYLGGENSARLDFTEAHGLTVDASGNAFVTGVATAADFPVTAGAFRSGSAAGVFVTQLNPAGGALVYSSKFAGAGGAIGYAIALDRSANAFVTGKALPYANGRWIDFPTTPGATQRCGTGIPGGFLVQLGPLGALKYSSQLGGGPRGSMGTAVALDAQGRVYVAGSTNAPGFPVTAGAVQTAFGGRSKDFDSTNLYPFAGDAFLTQIDLSTPSPFGVSCEMNAASFAPNLISPGEIVTFFGSEIGPETGAAARLDSAGRLPTVLAETRVLFDGVPAPLLFVRSDQVNTVAPFALASKSSTQVEIEYQGRRSPVFTIPVTAATPGIFTLDSSGSGQAAALNQDGSFNTPSNPARTGDVVVLFATGAGLLDPVPEDGRIVEGVLPRTLPATAYVCFQQTEVLYSGSAPGLIAGAVQVNLRVPEQCGPGAAPVALLFGGAPSQTSATISVR